MMVVPSYCFLYYNMYTYIIIYNTQTMKSLNQWNYVRYVYYMLYVYYVQ